MALSSDLISQFVKATNDNNEKKTEATVYGTIKISDGKTYVHIDGSTVDTPVTSTTDVQNGDRVTVLIKDHAAVVTGNLSAPSATKDNVDKVEKDLGTRLDEFDIIVADKVSTKLFDAETARIDTLYADILEVEEVEVDGQLVAKSAKIESIEGKQANFDKVSADVLEVTFVEVDGQMVAKSAKLEELEATDADFRTLESDYGVFKELTTGDLYAEDGTFKGLTTEDLYAEDGTIKYANIDFSNIGKAAMEYLYAASGLIENVVVGDGTITGNLIGVTIKGDLIEGNTIVADKLVLKGTDGIYYKLNYDGGALEGEGLVDTTYYLVDYNPIDPDNPDDSYGSLDWGIPEYVRTEETFEPTADELAAAVLKDGAITDDGHEVYCVEATGLYFCKIITYPDWADDKIHGSILVAKSVTAEQISVKDLVAFDATIGGFNITDTSIYSEVKDSEGNTTRGIYMDTEGQFNFGDAINFVKYYKDADGSYKLAISAESIRFALNDGEYGNLADIMGHVNIGTYEDEPCIELGQDGSAFKLIITNTRILFKDGDSTPAYVSNQALNIDKAVVENELQIGDSAVASGVWVWKTRANGNLGLAWKGVTE